MAKGNRSFRIPLLAGTPAGKLLAGGARVFTRCRARGTEETAVARIELTGAPRAKVDERQRGLSKRLDRALKCRSTVACLRHISHWRVPPNWSHRDWSGEIRAQTAAAAWQAACDYDASRGVPFEAFVRERVNEAALGRYRREWQYVIRNGGPNDEEPRTEAVDSDLVASLRDAVKILSPAEKRLIQDLFWHERTEASVAERCRVSQQAVSKRKKAVLRHLRQLLTLPLRIPKTLA